MRLAKMFLDLFTLGKFQWLRHVETDVFRFPALIVDPLLYHCFVLHDTNASFEHLERHVRETFRMQFAELVLVIVIVRRSENDAADAALRDEGVSALGWISLRAFGLVKGVEMFLQRVSHRFVLAQPQRVVECADKERLRDRTVGLFLYGEDRVVS